MHIQSFHSPQRKVLKWRLNFTVGASLPGSCMYYFPSVLPDLLGVGGYRYFEFGGKNPWSSNEEAITFIERKFT